MDRREVRNIVIYIVSALMSLLFIAYIVYHLVIGFTGSVETQPAQVVTVSDSYNVDGYIFKNDVLLGTTDSGTITYLFDEGSMIRRGTVVADIYQTNNSKDIENQLNNLEKKIEVLKTSNYSADVALSDASAVDSQIDSLFYSMQTKKNNNDLSYIFRRKDDLRSLLNKRQLVLKTADDFTTGIEELQAQKNAITASLGGVSRSVTAENSGYLFYDVDGYEYSFTGTFAQSMTYDDFKNVIQASPTIVEGRSIGKISTNFAWYLACEIPSVQQQFYIEGNDYNVRFPYSGDETISMTLSRIITSQTSDSMVVLFSTRTMPDGFSFLRKQSVEIIQESYTGYRIPVSSVRIVDDRKGVYVKSGNICVFKEIEPVAEINGYLIVKEQDKANDPDYSKKLGNYDLVITKGKDLYENKIID